MKYAVLVVVVVGLLALLRLQRRSARRETPPAGPPQPAPPGQAMVRCVTCGLHLPRPEALSNAHGDTFCCREHLIEHDRAAGDGREPS